MMQKIKFLTSGESHGKGLLGILEGMPAGLDISEDLIAIDLARRQMGFGRGKRMNIEQDRAEIISGVRFGKTLGSPIGLSIRNLDWENWQEEMAIEKPVKLPKEITVPRPGHADLAGTLKYGFSDIRNVLERSSARETAMRVALGTIARALLKEVGAVVGSRVIQIHKVTDTDPLSEDMSIQEMNQQADNSPVRCLNSIIEKKMIQAITEAKRAGNSVGGIFEVVASGVPLGLGTHVHWERKLHARLAEAVMSINAIKGIEIGLGFTYAGKFGSEVHDEIGFENNKYVRYSNNAGGIEGGMSNGEPIIVRAVMKPIPTLIKPLKSVDIHTKERKDAHKERTDSCAVPAASIVGEAMVCLVLADALLETFGGDTVDQLKQRVKDVIKQ
jgi:chorismate synthase